MYQKRLISHLCNVLKTMNFAGAEAGDGAHGEGRCVGLFKMMNSALKMMNSAFT